MRQILWLKQILIQCDNILIKWYSPNVANGQKWAGEVGKSSQRSDCFNLILCLEDKLFGFEKRHSWKREPHIHGKSPWSNVDDGIKREWTQIGRERREWETVGVGGQKQRERGREENINTCRQSSNSRNPWKNWLLIDGLSTPDHPILVNIMFNHLFIYYYLIIWNSSIIWFPIGTTHIGKKSKCLILTLHLLVIKIIGCSL